MWQQPLNTTNTGCIEHLVHLLTSGILSSSHEERLVTTYLCVLLPHLTALVSHQPAPPELEATLCTALRWTKNFA